MFDKVNFSSFFSTGKPVRELKKKGSGWWGSSSTKAPPKSAPLGKGWQMGRDGPARILGILP